MFNQIATLIQASLISINEPTLTNNLGYKRGEKESEESKNEKES